LLKLKGKGTAQPTHQGTQPGAVVTALHFRQQRGAVLAGFGVVFHHRIHSLNRQQLRPRSGMALLAAAFAATALAPFSSGLNPWPSLEGGLEELRELRPIRSRRLASSVAKAVS
jgi:hypothetical protein